MARDFNEADDAGDERDFDLPDAKEVNRRERELRRQEKAAEKVRAAGKGSHAKLFKEACEHARGNPQGQFAYYLSHAVLLAAIGRSRQVSEKTRTDYGATLLSLPAILKQLRRPIQDASQLGRAHVIALMRYWESEGLTEGTVNWRVSHLRRFFTLIGKPDVLPSGQAWRKILKENGITVGTRGRAQVATAPKGWRDRGIDPLPILDEMRVSEPVVASQQDLSLWFGLRKNEALQIRPAESDKGAHLVLEYGTKGGKPRTVDFSQDPEIARNQRLVLDRAKEIAAKHKKGILTIPGLTLKQARNHVNYVLRKHGITKKGLGVTQHGLRHQFGCDLLQTLSGLPAPALAAIPPAAYEQDPEKLMAARKSVSRQMGHERVSITNAYAGSVPALKKDSDRRLKGWLDAAAGAGEVFCRAEVEEAWIIGQGAWGLPLWGGEALQICVRLLDGSMGRKSLSYDLAGLREALAAAVGVPVQITVNADSKRPAGGVEILFNQR